MFPELLPCPHCPRSQVCLEQDDNGYWFIACGACGARSGHLPDRPGNRERIIAHWNTRSAADIKLIAFNAFQAGILLASYYVIGQTIWPYEKWGATFGGWWKAEVEPLLKHGKE